MNRPELDISCRIIKSLILHFREQFGQERLYAALASANLPAGVDAPFIENEENWVTFDTSQAITDTLTKEAGFPEFPRYAGRRTASKEVLGSVFSFIKAFANVSICYRRTVEGSSVYNHAGQFTFAQTGPRDVEITYKSRFQEANRNICELRMGQFEAFPTIWGMPLAHARELECQVLGADACRYHFHWVEPTRTGFFFASASLGLATACLLSLLSFSQLRLEWILVGCGAGGIFGAMVAAARSVRQRDELMRSQGDDYIQTVARLREQFSATAALNTTLEARVEARTHDLQVATERLQSSLKREQDLAAVKSQFIANVSHELRTPLTLILGPLEELLQHTQDAHTTATLTTIRNNGRVLLRHVNMLLDYATVEAGAARCNLAQGNIGSLVESWANNAAPQADQLGVFLEAKGVNEIPDTQFDYEKIETIFTNLLANALKFTPRGGTVTCRTYHQAGAIFLEVEDTGCGISKERAEHVFDRFYQAEEGAPKPSGTGLGLALAKEYAEMHGGKLSVQSRLGHGALFRLEIPEGPKVVERRRQSRRREDRSLRAFDQSTAHASDQRRLALLATAHVNREFAKREAASGDSSAEGPADAPKILLVEDHVDLRRHMAQALSRFYRVESASNGAVAQQLARLSPPDLVISDVQMPEMDGFELCRLLREDSAMAGVPFIFVTASGASDQVLLGLQSGAVDYVVKPFDMRELVARIDAQLRVRRALLTLDERNSRLAAIGQSATSIAHDLRSPLQAIKGYAQLSVEWVEQALKNPGAGSIAAFQSDLEAIIEAVEHSQKMTDKVLDFVRSGAETFNKRPLHLGGFVQHICKNMQPELRSLDIALQVEVEEGDLTLPVDSLQMRRALENLLRNAREAVSSPRLSEGHPRSIRVQAYAREAHVVVRVSDTGEGIPPEVKDRLFQPFASAGKLQGTGLGLSVVWNVVMAHGGTVQVSRGDHDQGTAFEMTLPRVAIRAVVSAED